MRNLVISFTEKLEKQKYHIEYSKGHFDATTQ